MNTEIILAVLPWIIAAFIVIMTNKNTKPLAKPLLPVNTFETDIVFLHFLLEKELQNTENLLLPLSKKYMTTMIRDELLEKYELEISVTVYGALSDNYKANLLKYFNEESLMDYITRTISRRLLARCIELNIT